MSNDDRPDEYLELVKNLNGQPLIILAFCPTFQDGGEAPAVLSTLRRKGYELAFFILKDRFVPRKRSSANEISAEEVDAMKAEGSVKVLTVKMEAEERAAELRTFIKSRMNAK